MNTHPAHRPAAVAGRFYPAEPAAVRAQVQQALATVAPSAARASRPPKILVVPHAGWVYSGPIAAQAYALLQPWHDHIHRVVLLGPTHRVAVHGLAAPTVQAFDTPLGAVPIDHLALEALSDLPQVVLSDRAHADEHALEVQLPFLQTVLDHFTLVPLAVGRTSPAEVTDVIERLWGDDGTLIVISTDLSHYRTHAEARTIDADTVQRLLRLDPTIAHEQACGATPLNGALRAARAHGLQPRLLDLRNSGDTAGDRQQVVGYAALAFDHPTALAAASLGPALLARARNAIAARLGLPLQAEPDHPALAQPGATFVTLHRHGQLRGCVGRLEAGPHTLDDDVRHNACRAAFDDPRFAPLQASEWPGLQVEVSLIQPAQPRQAHHEADALAALRPGVDGVILEWQGHRATFLPQVWAELPDPRAFMAALKRKAGLPADFWADDIALACYQVQSFEEPRRDA